MQKKLHLILLISICLLTLSCSEKYGLNRERYQQTKEEAIVFWNWFEKNHTLLKGNNEGEASVSKELNKFKQNIGIFIEESGSTKQLTFSAGGNKELLPFIDILYAQKPNIDNWIFTKYIQAQPIPPFLCIENDTLHAKDLKLYADLKNDKLLLIVELNDAKIGNINSKILTQQYVVYAIGEESVMRHIYSIKFIRLGLIEDKFQAFNIFELKTSFESYFPPSL